MKGIYTLTDHCFPVEIVFPATKRAYVKMLKRMGLSGGPPETPGNITTFEGGDHPMRIAIWLSKESDARCPTEVMGLIAHECLHVVQYTERAMGTRFDDETACYFLQKLVMWMTVSYADSGRGGG